MNKLDIEVSDELKTRLESIAARSGKSVEECLQLALTEFVLHWETHLEDLTDLEEEAFRPNLRAVNE